MSKQDFCQGRKSFLQLFTMLQAAVQSQHGLGRCPGGLLLFASRLPAPGSSYLQDLVPSLEKQTVALTVIPNKTPVSSALIMFSRRVVQLGAWMLSVGCWRASGGEAFDTGGNFHCTPRWLPLWPRKPILSHQRRSLG